MNREPFVHCIRTQSEVAQIMTDRGYPMSRGRVHQLEKQAIEKLRERLQQIADRYFEDCGGE